MKLLLSYVPFQVLIGVLFGILFQHSNNTLFIIFVFILILSMVLMRSTTLFKRYITLFTLIIFGILSSWFSILINKEQNNKHHYTYFRPSVSTLQLTVIKTLKSSKKLNRYYAKVTSIGSKKACGNVLVETLKDSTSVLIAGDNFVCKQIIQPINTASSPYDFDYKKYLSLKKVYGKIRIYNYIKIGKSDFGLFKIQNYRTKIVAKLQTSTLSVETKGLLMAMLLGDREQLSKEMQVAFTNAGVVHLIAISGMHVGVLYFLLCYTFGFVKRFNYGNYIHVFIVVVCLWCFAVFSGLSTSVVRSVTMFSFIILSKLKRKRGLLLEPIISSMLLLLLLQPNYLFDVGFQLSYTAVISIVVFYPLLMRKYHLKNKIIKYFVDVVVVSVVAQLGVLPITLYYFHQLPLQFLMANFIAVSLLPLVLYGGFLVLIKVLITNKWIFIERWFDEFIRGYINMINYFSSLESFLLKDISIRQVHVLGYYIVLILIWKLLYKYSYKSLVMLFSSLIIFQFCHIYNQYKIHQKEQLIIYNDYKNSIVSIKKDKNIFVFTDSGYQKIIHQNKIKNNIEKVTPIKSKVIGFKENTYVLVDDKLAYDQLNMKGLVLIIFKNPKINIERVLKKIEPKLVIIGASNFYNNRIKWKSTCETLQVPCYDVNSQGAYVVN
ncbi:competence protein ComEC [Wenyingzhuangia heitensis]|uniref:Competence protein ComEC n=1 Tax=Wenyingzhuangia heitensis TaxID=1487859 RepID=A0ABX0UBC2_9FLAO|nr:ComEC/Rec2 family competence protein [Wenyingzhuangia heitensis]NIJ46117.1 competence protein ComEC [Wenyingzhuangia heitensis]